MSTCQLGARNSPGEGSRLLEVLRQLPIETIGSMFKGASPSLLAGARLACGELRDAVDCSVESITLRVDDDSDDSKFWALHSRLRSGGGSRRGLLSRLSGLSSLTVEFGSDLRPEDCLLLVPLLTAGICGARVTSLAVVTEHESDDEGEDMMLATVNCATALGALLPCVRQLRLASFQPGWNSRDLPKAVRAYTALRVTFPGLERLSVAPAACLVGVEAFSGSNLTTVDGDGRGPDTLDFELALPEVNSLLQLPQLRRLNLQLGILDRPDAWRGAAAVAADRGVDARFSDADDSHTLRGRTRGAVEQLHALRRLLGLAPECLPQLERICVAGIDANGGSTSGLSLELAGGRVTGVDVQEVSYGNGLAYLAAALLPCLGAVEQLQRFSVGSWLTKDLVGELGRAQSPLARLLARCPAGAARVRKLTLEMHDILCSGFAAALLQLVRSCGLPREICVDNKLRLLAAASGGGTSDAAAEAAAAPAPSSLASVLSAVAQRMWRLPSASAADDDASQNHGHGTKVVMLISGPRMSPQPATGGVEEAFERLLLLGSPGGAQPAPKVDWRNSEVYWCPDADFLCFCSRTHPGAAVVDALLRAARAVHTRRGSPKKIIETPLIQVIKERWARGPASSPDSPDSLADLAATLLQCYARCLDAVQNGVCGWWV